MNTGKAVLALTAGLAIAPQAWSQSSVAQLRQVNGNVLVSRATGMTTGGEAQSIANGTRIITTANSRVVVIFNDGCRVEMTENQRLDVDSDKPCAALLPQGLGVAPGAPAVSIANYVVPGLLVAVILAGDDVLSGGRVSATQTSVSPN